MRYKISDNLDMGMAYLYDDKDERSATNDAVDGAFSDGGAHLLTIGFSYKL